MFSWAASPSHFQSKQEICVFIAQQAHFRGQRVRRRLAEALKAAQFYDNDEEEEFDYDEEVDLAAFDFDETSLEQGWTPSETPQLPGRYCVSSHCQKRWRIRSVTM